MAQACGFSGFNASDDEALARNKLPDPNPEPLAACTRQILHPICGSGHLSPLPACP